MAVQGRWARRLRATTGRLRGTASALRRDESGNVAIMTAFTLVSVALVLGGSIDLYRYETERKRVQAVVDACTLLGTRVNNGADTEAEVQQLVVDCAATQDVPIDLANVEMTTTTQEFDDGIRGVRVRTASNMGTTFLRLANIESLAVNGAAEAYEQEQYAEISIVLDLSGSMMMPVSADDSRRRFDLMRDEVANFVTTLLSNGGSETTSISVVPYSSGVNIGPGMFASLGVTRDHDYSSCALVKFKNNKTLRSVAGEMSRLTQGTPTMGSGAEYLHGLVTDNGVALGGREHRFARYEPIDGDTDTYVGPNKLHWPGNDTTKEVDAEMWACPDDPHAYMMRPYEPSDVTERAGRLPTVPVNGTRYPLYRGPIANHVVECESVRGEERPAGSNDDDDWTDKPADRCTWSKDDWTEFLGGTFEPRLSTSNGRFVSSETADRAFERGDLRIDGDDGSITYLSNDPVALTSKIQSLPVGVSTGTDQGLAWAYFLLHPDMRTYLNDATDDGHIDIPEAFSDRPRKWKDDPSLRRGDPALKTKKFIVLLTDGATSATLSHEDDPNTTNRDESELPNYDYDGETWDYETATDTETARERVQKVCETAIGDGITVYTIAFALDEEEPKKALVRCAAGDASAESHENAFEAGGDLGTVLQTIGASIQRLRLTS